MNKESKTDLKEANCYDEFKKWESTLPEGEYYWGEQSQQSCLELAFIAGRDSLSKSPNIISSFIKGLRANNSKKSS